METTIAIYSNSEMRVNNTIKSFKILRPAEYSESTSVPSVLDLIGGGFSDQRCKNKS